MADTKRKIGVGDIALLVLSVFFAVGMFTIFAPCGPKEDGSWMVCHWAGNAVKGLAIVLAALSVAHIAFQNGSVKIGLSLAIVPVALFAAIVPGNVISLCMMKTMKCHAVTQPAGIVLSALIIIAAVLDIVLQKKNNKA